MLGIETQTVDVDKNCNFLRKWYEKITTFKITKFLTSDSRDNLAEEGINSLNWKCLNPVLYVPQIYAVSMEWLKFDIKFGNSQQNQALVYTANPNPV